MISSAKLVAFVASTDLDRSEAFYTGSLGLAAIDRNPHAVIVDALGTELRITLVPEKAEAGYTVLGWGVADFDTCIADLEDHGIEFLRFDGMGQDEKGV